MSDEQANLTKNMLHKPIFAFKNAAGAKARSSERPPQWNGK
jgi:hypothetical protein